MGSPPVQWGAEALWEAVVAVLPGFTVEVLPAIDSTNSELMRRARDGLTDPVLLVAEQQMAGRGRLGRDWHSQAGASLTFSLGLPLAAPDWSGLSLAVGVSLAESLHPDVRLKWPNDLWLEDRKLGGILIETASFGGGGGGGGGGVPGVLGAARYAVVGVGLNLRLPPRNDLTTPPAALQELLPDIDAPVALRRVVLPLVLTLRAFELAGFSAFQSRFNARDVLRDRPVTLSDGTGGTAHGVGEDGALLVHTASGMKQITSSEISVRPQGAPEA